MKNILIVGAGGQIGSELTRNLRNIYGDANVVSSDLRPLKGEIYERGPVERIDSTQIMQIAEAVKKYNIDTIYNLAAILSATAELNPMLGWNVGIGSLVNCLEVARLFGCAVFTPSSIGAFGQRLLLHSLWRRYPFCTFSRSYQSPQFTRRRNNRLCRRNILRCCQGRNFHLPPQERNLYGYDVHARCSEGHD